VSFLFDLRTVLIPPLQSALLSLIDALPKVQKESAAEDALSAKGKSKSVAGEDEPVYAAGRAIDAAELDRPARDSGWKGRKTDEGKTESKNRQRTKAKNRALVRYRVLVLSTQYADQIPSPHSLIPKELSSPRRKRSRSNGKRPRSPLRNGYRKTAREVIQNRKDESALLFRVQWHDCRVSRDLHCQDWMFPEKTDSDRRCRL
jgi:hypothetical protein